MLARRRKLVFAAVTTLLALLLLVAAVELGLRARYERIERITGVSAWETGRWEGLTYHWDRYHPRWGWTNQPGYRSGPDVPFRVTINAQGLRGGRDYPPRPPPGTARVAVFGDSCIFGEEVDDDGTVPLFVERQLEGVEALNFGVHGYGLGQMVLRLEEQGLELAPDHVVLAVLLPTDLVRAGLPRTVHAKPVFGLRDGELVVGNVPVPEASRQPWPERHLFTAAWLWGRPAAGVPPATLGEHVELAERLVARAAAAAGGRGARVTLVTLVVAPTLEEMARDPEHARQVALLRQRFAAFGVDVLDAVPLLANAWAAEGGKLTAPRGHWSARGNCLLGALIARHLSERRGWAFRGELSCPPGELG